MIKGAHSSLITQMGESVAISVFIGRLDETAENFWIVQSYWWAMPVLVAFFLEEATWSGIFCHSIDWKLLGQLLQAGGPAEIWAWIRQWLTGCLAIRWGGCGPDASFNTQKEGSGNCKNQTANMQVRNFNQMEQKAVCRGHRLWVLSSKRKAWLSAQFIYPDENPRFTKQTFNDQISMNSAQQEGWSSRSKAACEAANRWETLLGHATFLWGIIFLTSQKSQV